MCLQNRSLKQHNLRFIGLSRIDIFLMCRDMMMLYSKEIEKLGKKLFRLVSDALDLEPSYLEDMECSKGHTLVCHYYPECPEPDRTIGHATHSDPDFLTVILQDHIGGLQVLHQDHWVDVTPLRGALVVNIGDLLQVSANGTQQK